MGLTPKRKDAIEGITIIGLWKVGIAPHDYQCLLTTRIMQQAVDRLTQGLPKPHPKLALEQLDKQVGEMLQQAAIAAQHTERKDESGGHLSWKVKAKHYVNPYVILNVYINLDYGPAGIFVAYKTGFTAKTKNAY